MGSKAIPMRSSAAVMFLLAAAIGITTLIATAAKTHAAEQIRSPAPRYVAKDLGWSLKVPQEEIVAFQGTANFDGAGMGAAQMLYLAPNIAGFFAGLITHGILLDATRNSQKRKILDAADKVLAPYQPVLSSYKYRDLMQRALEKTTTAGVKRLVEPSEKPGADLLIESVPVFSMTQDQTAIVLDNAIAIYVPGAASATAYKNIIRVVSPSAVKPDLVSFWLAKEGDALKAESARLLAESLDLALSEIAESTERDRPHRTVRYIEGTTERMERGQIVKELCDRIVLMNLRGWLMSVPVKPGSTVTTSCGDSAPQAPKIEAVEPPQHTD